MCLNCFDFYDLPNQTDQYVTHLLEKHRIIVTDIELIVDLKRFIDLIDFLLILNSIDFFF